jgi:ankyrin repeat protein
MLACQKGDKHTVDTLLKKGADVTIKDNLHNHVLMFAIKSKKIKIVQTLIDHGAPLHELNDKKENLMHIAAQYGLPSIIELLNTTGVNAYQPNIYYQTPLHYAVVEPMEPVIDLFIELGLNSYDKDHFGESPYDRAESHYYISAINKFTRQKNSPLTARHKKTYPLHTALRFKHYDEALSLLTDKTVNIKDQYNNTPLFYAIMHRDLFVIDHILRYKPSLFDIDYTHKDALFYAVLDRNVPLIKKLMQHITVEELPQETQTLIAESENVKNIF